MIVPDTSIWIEFLKQNPTIVPHFSALLKQKQIATIEPIFAELLFGVRKPADKKLMLNYWKLLPQLTFTKGSMILSASYANEQNYHNRGIGLMDACIIKPLVESGYRFWTLDKRILENLENMHLYNA